MEEAGTSQSITGLYVSWWNVHGIHFGKSSTDLACIFLKGRNGFVIERYMRDELLNKALEKECVEVATKIQSC